MSALLFTCWKTFAICNYTVSHRPPIVSPARWKQSSPLLFSSFNGMNELSVWANTLTRWYMWGAGEWDVAGGVWGALSTVGIRKGEAACSRIGIPCDGGEAGGLVSRTCTSACPRPLLFFYILIWGCVICPFLSLIQRLIKIWPWKIRRNANNGHC